ncbi:MAG: filamentous hemagglutinin N-terminal domain-containing protein [Rhodospirillaceae bacterium]
MMDNISAVCTVKRKPSHPILSQAWLLGPAFVSLGISLPAEAIPQGGTVVSGSATISQSGNALKVVQTTDKAAINWRSYNISAAESVTYYQPSSQSITLNRVLGGSTSFIDGRLTANGQVWLSNPAGILFGPNARVNVGGLIATTHDLKVEEFNADRYRFKSDVQPSGIVENQGRITVADAGLAAFVAPGVVNHGVITARLGEVTLASGNEFTVDLYGDQKINLSLDNKVAKQVLGRDGKQLTSLVKNDGQIFADGGRVQITAAAAKGIVDNVVSIGGIVQAHSVEESNGEIVLLGEGGVVQVSGTLDASGKAAGRTGGMVTATGDSMRVKSGARIDVSGTAGGGQALIGGDFRGGGASAAEYAEYALRPARKPVPPAETTTVEAGAVLNADALSTGRGGELIVWSDGATSVKGGLTARGGAGGGDGGFIETSGHWLDQTGATISATASHGVGGTWLLDPYNLTISGTATTAATAAGPPYTFTSGASGTVVLASDIQAQLNSGVSVVLQTSGTSGDGHGNGDITIAANITKSSGGDASLLLSAFHDIINNGFSISSTSGKLNTYLQANNTGYGGDIVFYGSIRVKLARQL